MQIGKVRQQLKCLQANTVFFPIRLSGQFLNDYIWQSSMHKKTILSK